MRSIENDRLHSLLQTTAWVLIALETILALVVTGITGSSTAGFHNSLHCDVPSKLSYNLAMAIITFITVPLLYFFERYAGGRTRPWAPLSRKVRMSIFILLVIFWAAAVGTSFYTCSDLCSSCSQIQPSSVRYAGKCCNCAGVDGGVVDLCASEEDAVITGFERIHHWYQSTQALDVVVFILFAISAAIEARLHYLRKSQLTQTDQIDMEASSALPDAPPEYNKRPVGLNMEPVKVPATSVEM